MLRTREEWRHTAESVLPPEERYSERNRMITARYAGWYLENPGILKWAGMAAFASRQVGLAILAAELMMAPERGDAGNPLLALHRFGSERLMLADFEEIRQGNNNIYRDIAWAHAAYVGGGMAELEACASEPEDNLLVKGFGLIDRARSILRRNANDPEGELLVWEGNVALLRHEQVDVLQPVFDRLSAGGRITASFGSELDFSGSPIPGSPYRASFGSFHGYLETLAGMKSVANPHDRWRWVEQCVIPSWKVADRQMQSEWSGKHELRKMAVAR
ncbi:MAG: hypothetical protein JW764_02525 [Chlorobiaceae bacterium]|nr:hypothetical protein [Chlorobiaceae bacterium]